MRWRHNHQTPNRVGTVVTPISNPWVSLLGETMPGALYPTYTTAAMETLGRTAWIFDPLTIAIPDRPSTWTSDQTGFYYVTDTGTNVNEGYPGDPRGSLPSSPPAGSLVVVEGALSVSNLNVTWTGTSSDPIFLVSNTNKATDSINTSTSQMQFAGSYLVVDGLTLGNDTASPLQGVFDVDGSFQCIRHCTIDDLAGYQSANASLCGFGTDHTIYYDCDIGPNGEWDNTQGTDADYHGMKARGDDHMIIDCRFLQNQGDCVQIGDVSWLPSETQRFTAVGCSGVQHHQAGFWTKDSTDIFFIKCTSTDGYDGTNFGTHAGFGGQDDFTRAWIIQCQSKNNGFGVNFAGTDGSANGYVIGCLLYDQDPQNAATADGFNNWGLVSRTTLDAYFLFNTIHNVEAGLSFPQGNGDRFAYGNFVDTPGVYDHLLYAGTGTHNNDYNYFRTATTASITGGSVGTNDIEADSPGFVNEGADNFTPDTGSALLAVIPQTVDDIEDVFDLYLSRYGIDLKAELGMSSGNYNIGWVQ